MTELERWEKLDRTLERFEGYFQRIDQRFEQVDQRFEQVDQRFEQVDQRFEQVDQRFEQVDQRFAQVEGKMARLGQGLDQIHQTVLGLETEHGLKLEALFDGFSLLGDRFTRMEVRQDRFEEQLGQVAADVGLVKVELVGVRQDLSRHLAQHP
jgi:chromosome segregation ATPase